MNLPELPTREKAHAPNARPKTAYLDEDRLEVGECEMEFRPQEAYSSGILVGVALKCLVIAIAIPALAPLLATIGFRQLQLMTEIPVVAFIAFAFVILMMAYTRHPLPTYGARHLRSVGRFLRKYALPVLLTAAFYRLLPQVDWIGAIRIYLVGSAVLIAVLADSVATHGVHWMTASPGNPPTVQESWRRDWRFRFLPMWQLPESDDRPDGPYRRAIEARTTYGLGFIWTVAAMTFPVVAVLYLHTGSDGESLRWNIASAVTLSLAIVALLRGRFRWMGLGNTLVHWLRFTPPEECPPWVFRSPSGGRIERCVLLYATVALLSILHMQVFRYELPPPLEMKTITSDWHLLLELLRPLAANAGFCLLQLSAAVVLIAGPVLTSFHDLFEEPSIEKESS